MSHPPTHTLTIAHSNTQTPLQAPEGYDITKWGPGDKAFEKAWAAKVKVRACLRARSPLSCSVLKRLRRQGLAARRVAH